MANCPRGLTIAMGQPNEDCVEGDPLVKTTTTMSDQEDASDNKYSKKRRKTMLTLQKRTRFLAAIVCLSSFFFLARFVTVQRQRARVRQQYARAEAVLREIRNSQSLNNNQNHHHDDKDKKERTIVMSEQTTNKDNQTPTILDLEQQFERTRYLASSSTSSVPQLLTNWMKAIDKSIVDNVHGGIRWVRPYLLPHADNDSVISHEGHLIKDSHKDLSLYHVKRQGQSMQWQTEYKQMMEQNNGVLPGPPVDYTDPDKYLYPPLLSEPPATGGYPSMTALGDLMKEWDQDEDNQGFITETLLHFDYTNPQEMAVAKKFRDAALPFKLKNVPEIARVHQLWTDEYVDQGLQEKYIRAFAQESPNNFFAFFTEWQEKNYGLPPSRTNDWKFKEWAEHARYADAKPLDTDQPHFYWQVGVPLNERLAPKEDWSFISRDLPSFSSTEPNFLLPYPDEQKGIQCRFGERGVVAATHYDYGRNMVAMITGAKRYILSPPNACGKLGIVTKQNHPAFRHSMLNFGHMKYMHDPKLSQEMSSEEREWLVQAATAPAVETVLKAGEVLYIPSFWFHYIVSVQKSTQCNVRSGVESDSHWEFGGREDLTEASCRPA